MNLFKIFKEDAHICIHIFGIKMRFQNPLINRLTDCCCIYNLEYFVKQNTEFVHPLGIVIAKGVKIGKDCKIFQNVTIGANIKGGVPQIGNNVIIFANSIIIGDISIGDNVIIGGGSVVIQSIPDNVIVAGNPAKIIKQKEG